MPRVLWTRCLPSMLLLTRPLHWHSASLFIWLWSLFTEGADFSMFHLLLTICSQTRKHTQVPLIPQFDPLSMPKFHAFKFNKTWKIFSSSQGWRPKRGKGMCGASTEKQASPSACRELWRSTEGHVQYALLPGSSPLTRPYSLRQDCASGQGIHERGTKVLPLHYCICTAAQVLSYIHFWCPSLPSTKAMADLMSKTKW